METETNAFIRYRRGRNIFAFRCPVCGTTGELAVPDGNRNGLVPCPSKCGAQFMVRRGRGFFAKPTLEFAFGPGAAQAEKQGGEMAKCEEWDSDHRDVGRPCGLAAVRRPQDRRRGPRRDP